MASFLFTAPVCCIICSLVGLIVSENSSVAPCGCGTSQGLGDMATMTSHPIPAHIISVLCQKWGLLEALQMTCAVLVKRWWQMLINVSTSVCGGYARCLFAWSWSISVPQTEMVATVHHQKENGPPCQMVEIGVMMNLEYGSAELRLCSSIFCPTVSDVCHRADLL